MSTSQQLAIEEIENWRSKARNYSKTDKLGHVLVNSLDLLQNVLVSGPRSQSLPFKIRGLSMECASAMAEDPIKEDESRSLHYGITLSLCAFLIALTSGDDEAKTAKDEQQDPHPSLAAELSPLHSLLGLVKEEHSTPKKAQKDPKDNKEGDGAVALFRDNVSFDTSPSRQLQIKEEPKEPAADDKEFLVMMDDIDDEDDVEEKSGPSSAAASAAGAADASAVNPDEPSVNPVAIMQMLFSPSRNVGTPHATSEDNQLPDMNEDSSSAVATSSSRPVRKRAPSSRASFGVLEQKRESAKKKKIKAESDEEPKPFACTDCDRTFDLEADLARHFVSHTGLKCKECGRRTTTEEKLIEHYELRHPGMEVETVEPKEGNPKETDRFPCPSCDKKYGYQSELDVHILTHTGVSPFQCDQCDKAFKQRSHLKDHLRKRHGVMPHECKTCGEKFERVGELAEHKKAAHKKRMVNGIVVTI